MKLLLGVYFFLSFSFAFVSLAVSLNFLQGSDAKGLPLLYAIISAPWAGKPILGAIVDRIPLERSRFVCVGFCGAGVAWALSPYSTLWLVAASTLMCLADCAADAIMVEEAREHASIQRLSIASRSAGDLVGTLLGGLVFLGGYQLTMHCAAVCLLPMGVASLGLPTAPRTCSLPAWNWSLAALQAVGFLLSAVPTASTFILMSWTAGGMSPISIALASTAAQVGSLLGLWLGRTLRRDTSLWTAALARMAVCLSALGTHANPALFAAGQSAVSGFAMSLFIAPFVELTTRLVEKGNEAFSFSCVMAAVNLGGIASSGLESALMGSTGVSSVSDDPLPLIAACLLLGLLSFRLGGIFQSIRDPAGL